MIQSFGCVCDIKSLLIIPLTMTEYRQTSYFYVRYQVSKYTHGQNLGDVKDEPSRSLSRVCSLQRVLGGARNVPLPLHSVLVSFVAQNALAIFQVRNEVYIGEMKSLVG